MLDESSSSNAVETCWGISNLTKGVNEQLLPLMQTEQALPSVIISIINSFKQSTQECTNIKYFRDENRIYLQLQNLNIETLT